MSGTLREFVTDPGLRDAVAETIDDVYDGTDYLRPDVDDVIADALTIARVALRDAAEDEGNCNKVDECAAKAVAIERLADWLEGLS